jgi:desulfoferrodoxin (superoxide reductase-like protein)
MIRSLLGRVPVAAVTASSLVLAAQLVPARSAAEADFKEEKATAMADVLAKSAHANMGLLQVAGTKRRTEGGCSFCKWMTDGPCGSDYEEWDDCVHETKQVEGRNFVDVCRPFTMAMMNCINQHPDYYEELAQTKKTKGEKKEDDAVSVKDAWEWKAQASDLASKGPVLSAAAPGPWAGKESSHVPIVAQSGGRITVTSPHGTGPEHFIEYVWARNDATGAIIAVKKLAPADKPEVTFKVPEGVKSFTAFASCNL